MKFHENMGVWSEFKISFSRTGGVCVCREAASRSAAPPEHVVQSRELVMNEHVLPCVTSRDRLVYVKASCSNGVYLQDPC